jgi:hypothetical protein
MPTTFCTTANTVASRKKRSTCGPPESDRGEEGDHERALQRRVELHQRHALSAGEEHRDGDQQAPQHGRRQVVAREDRYEPPQSLADQESDAREGERLHEI